MKSFWTWAKGFGAWWLVVLFVALFVATFMPRCSRASTLEFELQTGAKIVRGPTWAAAAVVYMPRIVNDKADVRCRILIYGPSTLPTDRHQDQNAQVGCQVLSGFRHIDLGLGVQTIFRTDLQNAGGAAFWLSMRYRFAVHWAAEYSHSSNMGTKAPNLGSDFILLDYRF